MARRNLGRYFAHQSLGGFPDPNISDACPSSFVDRPQPMTAPTDLTNNSFCPLYLAMCENRMDVVVALALAGRRPS
jgi:hypothetical protein